MNVVMELRKCCNHPFLIKGMEEREVKRLQQQKTESKENIAHEVSELLVQASGKLILLDKLLPPLKENGHRVLIFSQFKIMLDILQDYLRLRSYHCERIDGGITGNDRQSAIDRFCAPNSNSFVMLLSTRAGGVGINLTAADTVIIYDSDWNPQNDLQAQARCHRIGQKKSVKIYRLLTSKTYELHMFHQASMKLGLDQAVLGGIRNQNTALTKGKRGASSAHVSMSKDEIENLLKHGAYEMFKEDKEGESEAASKRFSEESIDQILSRSTKIIHDPKANAGGENGGKKSLMSSFSKATFVSSTNPDDQVAIDDPDFWTKVIGLNGVEEEKAIEPSPLKKRRCRRQVKTYAQQYDSGEESRKAKLQKIKASAQTKIDEEEFVISGSSDEDEEESDDLADDDFVGGVKRKKVHPIQLPSIIVHRDRISDRLATFGYGRWEEVVRGYPLLKQYPPTEVKAFVAEYIASCVRVGASSAVTSALIKANPSVAAVIPNSAPFTPTLPGSGSQDIIEDTIDKFASRYRFLSLVTQDRLVRKLSLISIRPGLPRTAESGKAERDATMKLNQMERMYRVRQAIRMFISPAPPMVSLVNELQKIGDRSAIQYIIESGKLPDLEQAGPLESAPDREENQAVTSGSISTAAAQTSSHIVEDSKPSVESIGGPGKNGKSEPVGSAVSNLPSTLTPAEPVGSNVSIVPAPSPSDIEPVTSVGSAVSPASSTPSTTKPVESVASTALSTVESVKPVASSISSSSSTDPIVPELAPTSSPTTEPVALITSPLPTELAATVTPAVPTPSPSANDPEDYNEIVKRRVERKTALEKLRAIPDIGMAASVSPWWISLVDDVILLLYVFKDGWMKGRNLPSELVDYSSLFGSRASKYPPNTWPTVAILNKRVSSLLTAWTYQKKVKQATQKAARDVAHQDFVQKQVVPHNPQSAPAPMPAPALARPMAQPAYVGKSSYDATVTAKHNRFAKLVFMCGIPDVRICRDDRERREKWRYFLEDQELAISSYSCDHLRAEAMDLELSCRARLHRQSDQKPAVSNEISILGGFRGCWSLTSTQCRRLLHRIHLFRTLRSEILVLPPSKLTTVVSRIVRVLRADSVNEFPQWWASPRHDILLLQAVECYGFDEHLVMVWSLPLFAAANSSLPFPNTMWVENYVSLLAESCRKFVQRLKQQELEQRKTECKIIDAKVDPSAPPQHAKQASSLVNESKSDVIDGNKAAAAVTVTGALVTAEAEKVEQVEEGKKQDEITKEEDSSSVVVVAEDATIETQSSPVKPVSIEEAVNQDEAVPVVEVISKEASAVQVHANEDNAADKSPSETEEKASLSDHLSAQSPSIVAGSNAPETPSSDINAPTRSPKKMLAAVSEEKPAIVILSDDTDEATASDDTPAEDKNSTESVEQAGESVKEVELKAKDSVPGSAKKPLKQERKNSLQSAEMAKPDSALKRKRPIRSWEVITIDDSDDEDVAAKRVTRSRGHRR